MKNNLTRARGLITVERLHDIYFSGCNVKQSFAQNVSCFLTDLQDISCKYINICISIKIIYWLAIVCVVYTLVVILTVLRKIIF